LYENGLATRPYTLAALLAVWAQLELAGLNLGPYKRAGTQHAFDQRTRLWPAHVSARRHEQDRKVGQGQDAHGARVSALDGGLCDQQRDVV